MIYEQVDGVLMDWFLGLTLAELIMAELEINVVNSIFSDGLLRCCIHYGDNMFTLFKNSDNDSALNRLYSFYLSLNFTFGKFEDGRMHYLKFNWSIIQSYL